jgi:hypothetical protein
MSDIGAEVFTQQMQPTSGSILGNATVKRTAAHSTKRPDFSPEVGAVGRVLGGKWQKDVIDNLEPILDSFIHTKEMRNLHRSGVPSIIA